jgi:hypothetical protein
MAQIVAGTTSVSRYMMLFDTGGSPATGYTITDLDLSYVREGGALPGKVDATELGGVAVAWDDNKAIEIDATNMPGLYRVDWPDGAFLEGNPRSVILYVNGAGLQPCVEDIRLRGPEPTAALSDINLDHLLKEPTVAANMTAEVVDATVISRMLANGDTSAFVPSTDGLQPIRDAITAAAPLGYHPDAASTINTGNQDSGTYADTALDNGTRWTIGDENGDSGDGGASDSDYTIDVITEFNMGSNRLGSTLLVNGFFNRNGGGGYIVEIFAYNYTTDTWDKLSQGTADSEMRDSAVDIDYLLALEVEHTDTVTTPGEVKINFRSTRATDAGGDVLALDHVEVEGVATGGLTPAAIAEGLLDHPDGVETSYTVREALRLILSALAGKLSGAATTEVTIRDVNDGTDRVVATVDASGNRTALTLDTS